MLTFIIGLIVGAVLGAGIVYLAMRGSNKNTKESAKESAVELPEALQKKAENMQNLKNLITQKSNSDKITNDEVQQLLGVSDATAERYLEELESEGLITQSGLSGKYVYYTK